MRIAIIGNGIAGVTAALTLRKRSGSEITLISSESRTFFSRTALMYVYMGHMRLQDIQPYPEGYWKENGIHRIFNHVSSIDFKRKILHFTDDATLAYDVLILATGSSYNTFGWHGQDLDGVRGLYHLQDLEYLEERSPEIDRAVIVGGGLIGVELAEMLHSRHIPVTFLVRERSFWDIVLPEEESAMISRHILDHGIDLRLNTQLKEIRGNEHGKVSGVETNTGEVISCQYVGITAGVHPNVGFLRETELEIDRGILVDNHLRTNIPDVYAIGDCAELREPGQGRRPVEPLWYTGRMMGEVVAKNICGDRIPYDPGIWFNSAKFFDIEYQVYGQVSNIPEAGIQSLYWEHPRGRKSIRINYDAQSGAVVGFNMMGIRYRQSICTHWIKERTHIESVLKDLPLANFDPEFSGSHERDVAKCYAERTGIMVHQNTGRSWDKAYNLLNAKSTTA